MQGSRHKQQMIANGESGDNARKVVAMDLERGFVKMQMGHPVKEVSLV